MPSASDLLKKHSARVKDAQADRPRIQRKGATRPWQENLDKYAEPQTSCDPIPKSQDPIDPNGGNQRSNGGSPVVLDEVVQTPSEVPDISTTNKTPKQGVAKGATTSEALPRPMIVTRPQSERAAEMLALIAQNGFDIAMKYLLVKELANEAGLIQCSQQFMVTRLKISLKSAKRLFDDLCDRNLIELAKDADPSTKAPKEYRLVQR